ncbi:MAG: DNA recombination protein RmuC [Oscillospiraceae bacterium]|nr:DNA recombination protein RmuC [Oscillospiraceae bacterium]
MANFEYIILALLAVSVVLNIIIIITNLKNKNLSARLDELERELREYSDKNSKDTLDFIGRQMEATARSNKATQESLAQMDVMRFTDFSQRTNESLDTLRRTVSSETEKLDRRFEFFQKQSSRQMDVIRMTMDKQMKEMQESNEKKLEEMRRTVDEKLQKTLEDRISRSFKMVSERLEQVYASLGEMQKVGAGVDDLKRVLSNVKTRGILGEVQLAAILEEILSPEQYESNIATKKGSSDRVEFAVKLPGDDEKPVYLPVDAKFPLDAYQKLLDAYDSADSAQVQLAVKELRTRIKGFAKDIHSKYIDVPNTTEFAIMFLPVEGLYAEVVRYGMVEELQKEKINIAGPTTMAALLNSLQMGFRTLAIQKNSGQVWKVLGEVKTEFEKFEKVLDKAHDKMMAASRELDDLVGVRTRAINRKLRDVSEFALPQNNTSSDFVEKN